MTKTVSIVMTVLNDAEGCAEVLESIPAQVRQPDEVIVVDGGSTDGTQDVVRAAAAHDRRIRLVEVSGANIGQGRNAGIRAAGSEIIANTDTGCRLDPRWLAGIVAPFEDERSAEFVAGFYKIAPQALLEEVIGLSTMRGALDPVCPERFNPSGRSMAFTKALWQRAGGFPEFLEIDDTLFDVKIRKMNVRWVFAADAVVHWRPRRTLRHLFRQFCFYGCGNGHTQIFLKDNLYNMRNLMLTAGSAALASVQPYAWWLFAALVAYFYFHAFHRTSARVARAIGTRWGYPLTLLVHWTIVLGDACGYVIGTAQRWLKPGRYRDGMSRYLCIETTRGRLGVGT